MLVGSRELTVEGSELVVKESELTVEGRELVGSQGKRVKDCQEKV